MNNPFRAILGTLLTGAVFAACSVGVPAEETTPASCLSAAKRLIAEGKAAEAKAILDDMVKAAPDTAEGREASALVDRIRSIEVLVDFSHDYFRPGMIAACLSKAGWGVTRCEAYLPSLRARLADFEMIIISGMETDVPYDEIEAGCLLEYVQGGGRLVLIGDAAEWTRLNPWKPPQAYPLIPLAKRLGLRLNKETEELKVGKGRITFYRNTTLMTEAKLVSDRAEDRKPILAFFEALLPYPKIEDSSRSALVEPEIYVRRGGLTFRYPQSLHVQGDAMKKVLPRMDEFYRGVFHTSKKADAPLPDLAREFQFCGVPKRFGPQLGGLVPGSSELCMLQVPEYLVIHDMALNLFEAWLQPAAGHLDYPRWIDPVWGHVMAVDLMKQVGLPPEGETPERVLAGRLQRVDPDLTKIDLSVVPVRTGDVASGEAADAYVAKAMHVLRTLMRQHPGILGKFRETVLLYHDAGKLPATLTTDNAVRLLSLSAGKDLFPFFKSLGTTVTPVPLDFDEPERLRKAAAERAGDAPAPK